MIEGYLLILLGLFFDPGRRILIRPIPIEDATRPCKHVPQHPLNPAAFRIEASKGQFFSASPGRKGPTLSLRVRGRNQFDPARRNLDNGYGIRIAFHHRHPCAIG